MSGSACQVRRACLPVVKTIHIVVEKVLHTPETVNKLAELGLYAETSTPARYGKMIGEDIDRLGKIVKDANIKQQ